MTDLLRKTSQFSATQHCFTLNVLLFSKKNVNKGKPRDHIHSSSTSARHWSIFRLKLFYVLLTQHYPEAWTLPAPTIVNNKPGKNES